MCDFFALIRCYSAENRQNLRLTIEISAFHLVDIFKCTIFYFLFKQIRWYFDKNWQNSRLIFWNMNFFCSWYFACKCVNLFFFFRNAPFSHVGILLKIGKIRFFSPLIVKTNFIRRCYFLKARFFCIKPLLFGRKSIKFATNFQNISFLANDIKCAIFSH